jgi:hypothetical protein
MQPVEDFMHEFFTAHADVERAKFAAYRPFRDRFFVDGYEPFGTYELRHSCEAERMTSVAQSASGTIVTTSTVYRSLQLQFRYCLNARGESWVITKVETLCKVCNGSGRFRDDRECTRCEGKGWEVLAAEKTGWT